MKKLYILLLLGIFPFFETYAKVFRIGFYNVENLFDYFDDSLKNDDEFTPLGIKRWTKKRYEQKCVQLYKVISALNADMPLVALGVCEVENSKVLRDLCYGTPLRQLNFDFVHYESNDNRGIDVALLYRKDYFTPLISYPIPLIYEGDSISRTRDILYVKGLLFESDTLHLFIHHFPSKYGGAAATIEKRAAAAALSRKSIEKIQKESPNARIIAMGDFNDEPLDASIHEVLGAICKKNYNKENLINLMCPFIGKQGSHKFRQEWSIIDQIIVNRALYEAQFGICIKEARAHVFFSDFLLSSDLIYLGKKPFRTHLGMQYLGGFSDHLPIFIELNSITKHF